MSPEEGFVKVPCVHKFKFAQTLCFDYEQTLTKAKYVPPSSESLLRFINLTGSTFYKSKWQ